MFIDTPLDVCETRDCKGLYKMAREGKITQFTGINDPFEEPLNPEFKVNNSNGQQLQNAVTTIIDKLTKDGYL